MEPKINLLVVEDEALIAENLRLSLEDLGYAVLATCYTYAEAQAALAQHTPDLVLLDINLSSAGPQSHRPGPGPAVGWVGRPAVHLPHGQQRPRHHPAGHPPATQAATLIKPVNSATLFAAIQTALERHATHAPAPLPAPAAPAPVPDYFFVKLGDKTHKLPLGRCVGAGSRQKLRYAPLGHLQNGLPSARLPHLRTRPTAARSPAPPTSCA